MPSLCEHPVVPLAPLSLVLALLAHEGLVLGLAQTSTALVSNHTLRNEFSSPNSLELELMQIILPTMLPGGLLAPSLFHVCMYGVQCGV